MSQSVTPLLQNIRYKLPLLLGIILVAINLRPALAGIGPLVNDIQRATGLSNAMLGLLTTIPLIAFGTLSIFTPFFTDRFGLGKTLLGAMLLLSVGIALRSFDSIALLYIGTGLVGIAIAFGNVILPSLAKQNFSEQSGLITSLYSSTMGLGAAIAIGTSVPLADAVGWQMSLGLWTVAALLAAIVWIPLLPALAPANLKPNTILVLKQLLSNRLAWSIALFMGFQSLTFYVVLAWLPAILHDAGLNDETAGWLASLCQAMGMVGSLLVPLLATRKNNQCALVVWLITAEMTGLVGLTFFASNITPLWIVLMGFAIGGLFSLALLFLVLRSSHSTITSGLSGMVQSVGYLIAAIGPVIFASIFDIIGSWHVPLAFLFCISLLKLLTGIYASQNRLISESDLS